MKRIFSLISLAAAAAIIGSCAKEICEEPDAQENAEEGFVVTVTSSVSFGPNTRALTDDGVKTFAVGEQVAIIYPKNTGTGVKLSNALTSEDISADGKSATFTVTLQNPVAGDVTYVYPAAMVDSQGNEVSLKAQDGTLEGLQAFDYAKGTGELTVDGSNVSLPLGVALANQLAVGKFTLKDGDGSAELSGISFATINDGTQTYKITPVSPATTLTWPIYVAMKPLADTSITFAAKGGLANFHKKVTHKTLTAGSIYPITLQMPVLDNAIDLSLLTTDLEAQNGDILTNTLIEDHKISIADGATITLRDAGIPLSNDICSAGIACVGDATILLEGINSVRGGGDCTIHFMDPGFDFSLVFWAPGISIDPNHTLTIDGSGELTVKTNSNDVGGSAIGNWTGHSSGTVIINGGTIYATGAQGCPAIGGGYDGSCDEIRITGGTVYAWGGESAAAIGGSRQGGSGPIIISGGKVVATGGVGAAGIGAGQGHDSNSTCGDILISGGEVTAIGGDFAAGIGCGMGRAYYSTSPTSPTFYDYTSQSICGNITISGGTVTARGGEGGPYYGNTNPVGAAAIGTGATANNVGDAPDRAKSSCGEITILNTVTRVTATKASDATNCIGKNHSENPGTFGTITIGETTYPTGVTPNQTDGNTFIYPAN